MDGLVDYSEMQDLRWEKLIEVVACRIVPIDKEDAFNIAIEAKVAHQSEEFQKQVHAYLKAFTIATTHKHITSGSGRTPALQICNDRLRFASPRGICAPII